MATKNRHLRGATNDITLPVHGNIVVEKGDFIVENKTASTMTSYSTADSYGFPVSSLINTSAYYYALQFAGVAMTGSISGVTNNIFVATSGQFRYPLAASSSVSTGMIVNGATSAYTSAYDQKVTCWSTSGVSSVIGRCIKTATSPQTDCDFQLITRYSGVSYQDLV